MPSASSGVYKIITTWTKDELTRIAAVDELKVSPLRDDGVSFGTPTPIWSVVVEDDLYVRAYYGRESKWFQAAIKQKAGRIDAGGALREVTFEPVDGSINDQIDAAYRVKYRASRYLGAMVNPRARLATIKIHPRGA